MASSAFKSLYKKCSQYCIQRLQRLTSSQSDAKELFVKAITKYWIKYKQGTLKNIENPEKFILVIAKNMWYDEKRKKNLEQSSNAEELELRQNQRANVYDEEEFNTLIKKENIQLSEREQQKRKTCLKRAFKQLKPNCQKLLTAVFTYEKNNKQVQKELGYASIDVVKTTKYRCKEHLKKLYLKEYNKTSG